MQELILDDLAPIEIPVPMDGKQYLVREASAGAVCQWRNAVMKAAKLGMDGRATATDGLADTEPLLVSLCVFEKTTNGEKAVPLTTVRSWSSRRVKRLFDKIQEISDLSPKEKGPATESEDLAKNGLAATTDTSV